MGRHQKWLKLGKSDPHFLKLYYEESQSREKKRIDELINNGKLPNFRIQQTFFYEENNYNDCNFNCIKITMNISIFVILRPVCFIKYD